MDKDIGAWIGVDMGLDTGITHTALVCESFSLTRTTKRISFPLFTDSSQKVQKKENDTLACGWNRIPKMEQNPQPDCNVKCC